MGILTKFNFRNWQDASGTFWRLRSLVFAAVVLIVLATLRTFIAPLAHDRSESAGAIVSAPFPFWVVSSLVRVGQKDAPGPSSSITLSAARGETVDTQIIVQAPAGGLTNVNLSASALTGPTGA